MQPLPQKWHLLRPPYRCADMSDTPPTEADFTVESHAGSSTVKVTFNPTGSEYSFTRLDPSGLSDNVHERHGRPGGTGPYSADDVRAMARRLAERGLRRANGLPLEGVSATGGVAGLGGAPPLPPANTLDGTGTLTANANVSPATQDQNVGVTPNVNRATLPVDQLLGIAGDLRSVVPLLRQLVEAQAKLGGNVAASVAQLSSDAPRIVEPDCHHPRRRGTLGSPEGARCRAVLACREDAAADGDGGNGERHSHDRRDSVLRGSDRPGPSAAARSAHRHSDRAHLATVLLTLTDRLFSYGAGYDLETLRSWVDLLEAL